MGMSGAVGETRQEWAGYENVRRANVKMWARNGCSLWVQFHLVHPSRVPTSPASVAHLHAQVQHLVPHGLRLQQHLCGWPHTRVGNGAKVSLVGQDLLPCDHAAQPQSTYTYHL